MGGLGLLGWGAGHPSCLKLLQISLLKFMFLEHWDDGGSGGGGVNQTLVKVMF